MLIENGANIDHKNTNDETPLIVDAAKGKQNTCVFSIPFFYCIYKIPVCMEVNSLFCFKKMNVFSVYVCLKMYFIDVFLSSLINGAFLVFSECQYDCEGSDKILQLLIDKGVNINAIDIEGRTALDAALGAIKNGGKSKNNYET